jgi:hypothetical protein
MPETTKGKQNLTVARIFFLLIVIPISLMAILIANGLFKVGNIAAERTLTVLDQKSQEEIKVRAINTADEVANFLMERKKDLLIATIIPATESSYKQFVAENKKNLWVKLPDGKISQVMTPLYSEMTFIDKKGNEQIKITNGEVAPKSSLGNVSDPQNTPFKSEDYFQKAIALNKGEIYVSPLTGLYVDRFEFEKGKRYAGVIRFATPVFGREGLTGILVITLDYRHLAEYTNHIIPTQTSYVYRADASSGNYAYMVDSRGFVIAHPNDYHIEGLYSDGTWVPSLVKENYTELMKKGIEVLNLKYLGFLDPALPDIEKDASAGNSGSKTYKFSGHTKFVAYAPVKFYSENLPKPAGFGWIAMSIDVDKYNEWAKATSKNIEKEAKNWTTTIVIILIIAIILLFLISALLAKGISRSISKEVPEGSEGIADYYEEDDDDDRK